jgi:hypothetical protein
MHISSALQNSSVGIPREKELKKNSNVEIPHQKVVNNRERLNNRWNYTLAVEYCTDSMQHTCCIQDTPTQNALTEEAVHALWTLSRITERPVTAQSRCSCPHAPTMILGTTMLLPETG